MRINIALIFVMIFSSSAVSQTIHENDLEYFVGCFAWTDTTDSESIDCSEFVDWEIVKPSAIDNGRHVSKFTYLSGKQCVFQWNSCVLQAGEVKGGIIVEEFWKYKFCIFMDMNGRERQMNVLTTWEETGRDSLRFVCAQNGPFDTNKGWVGLEYVGIFPDSSIFIIVDKFSGGSKNYSFLRGQLFYGFKEFYKSENYDEGLISGENRKMIIYDFYKTLGLSFQTIEVIEYLSKNKKDDNDKFKIDSVKTNILNLWEMAQEADSMK